MKLVGKIFKCNNCSKEVYRPPCNFSKTNTYFCSNKCLGEFRRKTPGLYPTKLSEETKENIRKAKLGNKNPMWVGDKIGNKSIHDWIKYRLKKPKLCQECKKVPPRDLANISPKYNKKTYNRDLKNWRWLCRKCHMKSDGRYEEFIKFSPDRKKERMRKSEYADVVETPFV